MTSHAPDFRALVQEWETDPGLLGELVHVEVVPARPASFQKLSPPPAGEVGKRLTEKGITNLYSHQAHAISKIRQRQHVVIVSSTASGKSLCYQVPLAEAVQKDQNCTALLIFPTKALAQDQARSLKEIEIPGIRLYNYDGDLPKDQRLQARRNANVIFTNPDMLHFGMLPYHKGWERFFRNLTLVVVDEMHYLRGIFGSHVSLILRRLRRIAEFYGAKPSFVFASATIGNPKGLADRLSGLDVHAIVEDGSPAGEKLVALWNPPMEKGPPGAPEVRRSALLETTDLLSTLINRRIPSIAFTRSRKGMELMYRWSSERLGKMRNRVAPYRAGYTAQDRRRIEQKLFAGELLGITTTNALELGIDIAGLDAALISTFPGTLSSFRQQSGRAGRSQNMSLVTLIGGDDALDQYFMSSPKELFIRDPESVVINPQNPRVLDAHAACAAHELPLRRSDCKFFGHELVEAVPRLKQKGQLRRAAKNSYRWANGKSPAYKISLRSAGDPEFVIFDLDTGRQMGTMEERRVYREAHEGAIYLHQGRDYEVERLDLRHHEIGVRKVSIDYFTETKVNENLEILGTSEKSDLGKMRLYLGMVKVTSQVTGYRIKYRKKGCSPVFPLDLPAVDLETQAFWFTLPLPLIAQAAIDRDLLPGSLHAAEHTLIAMMPLSAICDRSDIGGLSTPKHPDTGESTIFIYDGFPGGAGIAPQAYKTGRSLVEAAAGVLKRCPCKMGCPSCVQSPKCGNYNEPLSKPGALRLLKTSLR